MSNILSSIIAVLITAPILVYFLVFIISKQLTKKHRQSVHYAIDISTIFFILSVHFLVINIWKQSLSWAIFIFMLVCAIIFVIINWSIKGEIIFVRLVKGFWRFNFLIFILLYFVLTIYGLIQKVNSYM
jgi:hypothetical protein